MKYRPVAVVLGLGALLCVAGLLRGLTHTSPIALTLLYVTEDGGYAFFRLENHFSQPIDVRARFLEERREGAWRLSSYAPLALVVGHQAEEIEWTMPAQATNVVRLYVPAPGIGYRADLECYPRSSSPSGLLPGLRKRLAHLVFLTAPSVSYMGRPVRRVSLSRMKMICRIEGGLWVVGEPFQEEALKERALQRTEPVLRGVSINTVDPRSVQFAPSALPLDKQSRSSVAKNE